MKIIVAKSAGFCMGVRRAVNQVLSAVEAGEAPLWTLGSLIHNPQVVELLCARGVVPAKSVEQIDKGMVVIPTHGVSPKIRAELELKGLKILDATCPRVARVHRIVEQYANQGYLILVLGDLGHSEVKGILGFAGENTIVLQSPKQVLSLPSANQVLLVAQTTQSGSRFEELSKAVQERYAHLSLDQLKIINTLCDSTEQRQKEVRALAPRVSAFVIVGGKESANTRRLKEVAEAEGKLAYLMETEKELESERLKEVSSVGLTAGASSPNWLIRRVYEELRKMSLEQMSFASRILFKLVRGGAILNFYLGLGGALLCAVSGMALQGSINFFASFSAFLYLSSIHNFNLLANPGILNLIEPARGGFFLRYRRPLLYLSLLGMGLGGLFSFLVSIWAFIFYLGLCGLSLVYQVRFRKSVSPKFFDISRLADIPGSKDLFSALAWAIVIVLIPLSGRAGMHFEPRVWILFSLIFLLVLARSILQDFRDIQADRMLGKETLPILFGVRVSRGLIHFIIFIAGLVLLFSYSQGDLGKAVLGILIGLVWLWIWAWFFTQRSVIQGLRAELIIDANFIIAGLAGVILGRF